MSCRILVGDVRARLAELPDQSVQCVVTSPPYFGLRSYGTPPQVWGGNPDCDHEWQIQPVTGEKRGGNWAQGVNGHGEEQPGGVAAKRVAVVEKVDTGFCSQCDAWLGHLGLEPFVSLFVSHLVDVFTEVWRVLKNDGTLWLNLGDGYNAYNGGAGPSSKLSQRQSAERPMLSTGFGLQEKSLKPKDLIMAPHRLAIALQDAGWWVRSDIIWFKKAPMPESCTDRPTMAHEHIFLFTKNKTYYYDADAVRSPLAESSIQRLTQETFDQQTGGPKDYAVTGQNDSRSARKMVNNLHEKLIRQEKWKTRQEGWNERDKSIGANLRNVWHLGPEPFPDAHFATFPTEVPRRCIKAGSREGDTVLDPFAGVGTTGLVADELERDAILIELNPESAAEGRARIHGACPMFATVDVA